MSIIKFWILSLLLLHTWVSYAQIPPTIEINCIHCHTEALKSNRLPFVQKAQCTPCHTSKFLYTHSQVQGKRIANHPSHMSSHKQILQKRVLFNHQRHQIYGVRCEECHIHPTTKKLITISADQCVQCHQTKKASIRCDTCHETTALGKLRMTWPSGTQAPLIPQSNHSGMIHIPYYQNHHQLDALAQAQSCLQCHQQNDCDQCHATGRNRLQIHSPFYIKLHGQELQAQKTSTDCQSCHEPTRFCAPCHQRSGLHTRSTALSFSRLAPQKVSFHPINYAQSQHGMEASRDLAQCVSCHSERDCVACHSSSPSFARKQAGQIINPHRSNPCLIPKRASDLSCRVCHQNRARSSLCAVSR